MRILSIIMSLLIFHNLAQGQSFVKRKGHQFFTGEQPYYYIGTNYWYGGLLGLNKDQIRGADRLRRELDFLKSKGINNLRVLAGAEGTGLVHGVQRVGPPVQKEQGVFDVSVLKGLDLLLDEMGKRNMKAVLFFSNNWEWSGGFLQYLRWNNLIADSVFRRKLSWDEMRDYVSKFYSCTPCKNDYRKHVAFILERTNTINGKKYTSDPAIMAWELANEPRPMRPSANADYANWIRETAAFIKSRDKNHLVTIGHEGEIGSESLPLFEEIHSDKNVDYLTIHIWPKNWSWFAEGALQKDFPQVVSKTEDYISKHIAAAQRLGKPLVIEEFGLPRDGHSFDPASTTSLRDNYYQKIFTVLKQQAQLKGVVAGANFWAFNGRARPIKGQVFWKNGDDYMGDPPMEEQGLNGVFDSDKTTWDLIYSFTSELMNTTSMPLPSDKLATRPAIQLFKNLNRLMEKGIMFGHQDDLAYGVDWRYIPGKSDVKELVNDYPAVFGWELGNIEHELPYNLDSVPFDRMKNFIRQGYEKGGVITISWHGDNPLTGGSAWDTTHAVSSILPGGSRHELYRTWLYRVGRFLESLKDRNGEPIPVLFRPYHELTGNWFWWCRNTCTPTEFKLLWRFTVNYLRNEHGLHHLLYVYNTADFNTREEFLERYPGDDVVDLVSFDSYQFGDPATDTAFRANLHHRLGILEEVAKDKQKIPALAETGYERIPNAQWWTRSLWKAMEGHKISYVLLWRNHGRQSNGNWHYYVPKKNDISSEDFKNFYRLNRTLFAKDVEKEKLYQ